MSVYTVQSGDEAARGGKGGEEALRRLCVMQTFSLTKWLLDIATLALVMEVSRPVLRRRRGRCRSRRRINRYR